MDKDVEEKESICLYMLIAYAYAHLSHCERRKVGCVIAKDGKIISIGYNNPPEGEGWKDRNSCEYFLGEEGAGHKKTFRYVYHAETSAVARIAASTQTSRGASLFVTTSPCMDCAKLIAQCGIKEVFFCEFYLDKEVKEIHLSGIIHLEKSGVVIYRLKNLAFLLRELSEGLLEKKSILLDRWKDPGNICHSFEVKARKLTEKIKKQLKNFGNVCVQFKMDRTSLEEVIEEEDLGKIEKENFKKEIEKIIKEQRENFGKV